MWSCHLIWHFICANQSRPATLSLYHQSCHIIVACYWEKGHLDNKKRSNPSAMFPHLSVPYHRLITYLFQFTFPSHLGYTYGFVLGNLNWMFVVSCVLHVIPLGGSNAWMTLKTLNFIKAWIHLVNPVFDSFHLFHICDASWMTRFLDIHWPPSEPWPIITIS